MNHLKDFIECELGISTPLNTIGMCGISAPESQTPGSGDIPQCLDIKTGKIYKRRKKFNRYKL